VIIAVDGNSASGKTTFANKMAKETGATVIHMDDFFLQLHQRTNERFSEIGGNVDYERFEKEIINPLIEGKPTLNYHRFDCKTGKFAKELVVISNTGKNDIIIEGVYCMRSKKWREVYDKMIFMEINKDEQLKRLKARNPDLLNKFVNEWLPMEKKYFEALFTDLQANNLKELERRGKFEKHRNN